MDSTNDLSLTCLLAPTSIVQLSSIKKKLILNFGNHLTEHVILIL